jgi:hypothetical protein
VQTITLCTVGEKTCVELRVDPRLRDEFRTSGRANRFRPFGEASVILRREQALLDGEFAHRLLQYLEFIDAG